MYVLLVNHTIYNDNKQLLKPFNENIFLREKIFHKLFTF